MPDVMASLRQELGEQPLVRDFVVVRTETNAYNWPGDHLKFSEAFFPSIRAQVGILENRGLVVGRGDRFAYKLSEDFARYLRKARATA
jgi:hypothetical protein